MWGEVRYPYIHLSVSGKWVVKVRLDETGVGCCPIRNNFMVQKQVMKIVLMKHMIRKRGYDKSSGNHVIMKGGVQKINSNQAVRK